MNPHTSSSMLNTCKGKQTNNVLAFGLVAVLFLAWGVANNMNDTLLAAFKRIMSMSDLQSSLVQFAFFGAYFCVSLPTAMFIRRYSYKAGILLGLVLYAGGTMLFYPAGEAASYPFFLVAIYVMACGCAVLETTANPYILSMGRPETATRRLNFAQTLNPVGAICGILMSRHFILSELHSADAAERAGMGAEALAAVQHEELTAISGTYLLIGCALLVLFVVIAAVKMPGGCRAAWHRRKTDGEPEMGCGADWHRRKTDGEPEGGCRADWHRRKTDGEPEGGCGADWHRRESDGEPEMDCGADWHRRKTDGEPEMGCGADWHRRESDGEPEMGCGAAWHRRKTDGEPEGGCGADWHGRETEGVMVKAATEDEGGRMLPTFHRLCKNKVYKYGVIAQFFYVGVQTGVWSFTIRLAMAELGMLESDASMIFLYSIIAFTMFRFFFTWLMGYVKPVRLLTAASVLSLVFTLTVIMSEGWVAVGALIAISACMSLMFPTIYGIALRGIEGDEAKIAASGLIMAILGGAIITPLQAFISDMAGISASFWIPAACFVIIIVYSLYVGNRMTNFTGITSA